MSQGKIFGRGQPHAFDPPVLTVSRPVKLAVMGVLLSVFAAAIYGGFALWPDKSKAPDTVQLLGDGVTVVTADVVASHPSCPLNLSKPAPKDCGTLTVSLGKSEAKISVPPEVSSLDLKPGSPVRVMKSPREGQPPAYDFFGVDRGQPLVALVVVFVLVTSLIAWWRGLLAVLGLALSGAVIWWFMIPALLQGKNGIGVTVVGCTLIMYAVLYLAHGVSMRTSAALLGTLGGISITAALSAWAVTSASLTGVSDESGRVLLANAPALSSQGLLTAGLIVAGLGILNDVTITQASAVWELRAASGKFTRREIFAAAMRIGRDHIASTIYTLAFSYAGTSLALLMVLQFSEMGWRNTLADEPLVEAIARVLVASIGLMLALPITTAIATLLAPGRYKAAEGYSHRTSYSR